jgi:hypothetical protein
MGRLWVASVGWVVVAILAHGLVRHWSMYWAFGSAGLMTMALWLLALRTGAWLWSRHPPVVPIVRHPRYTRRIILEEETW